MHVLEGIFPVNDVEAWHAPVSDRFVTARNTVFVIHRTHPAVRAGGSRGECRTVSVANTTARARS